MSFFDRALPFAALAFALASPACKPVVNGCVDGPEGGAAVPDGDFEASPTEWQLAPHSTIDATKSICGGAQSLKIELDQGIGSTTPTRSPAFTGVVPGQEYRLSFHYRYESCTAAGLHIQIANYEKNIKFDGTDGNWGDTSIDVTFGSDPAFIDITPFREGAEGDFQGSEYENNLMWVDDFVLE